MKIFPTVATVICLAMQIQPASTLIGRMTPPLRIRNDDIHPKTCRSRLLKSRRVVFESEMDLKKLVGQSEMILVIPTSTTVSSGHIAGDSKAHDERVSTHIISSTRHVCCTSLP